MTLVPVDPVREAFIDSGLTRCELARRLDWWNGPKPDCSRVARQLGLVPWTSSHYRGVVRHIQDRRAAEILELLGLDPWEVGL